MSDFLDSDWITLERAAHELGCHVETLRLRVRKGRLKARRGPHGRYYVRDDDLDSIWPPIRFRNRSFDAAKLDEGSQLTLDELIDNRAVIRPHQRVLIDQVRTDPARDIHLRRLLAVHVLLYDGLTTAETAEHLGISTCYAGAQAAVERQARAERGRARKAAGPIVREIQSRLLAAGLRTARRDPKSSQSGARAGQPARVALVRNLDRATKRHLLARGLTVEQVSAISLLGIAADELNELVLRGLPDQESPFVSPNPSSTHIPPILGADEPPPAGAR